MLVRNNEKPRTAYLSGSEVTTAWLQGWVTAIGQYQHLHYVNKNLAEENAQLREQMRDAYFFNRTDSIWVRDSVTRQKQYQYIVAEVVDNSVNRQSNYITVNRGALHGVKPGSAVISAGGIVGIVLQTSDHYSIIMSLLHRSSHISAKLRRSNYFGSLAWRGDTPEEIHLDDIPKGAKVKRGDTIVTSGNSFLFPKGIMVGTVIQDTIPPGSNTHDVRVRLGADLGRIEHVYIINNILKPEAEKLKQAILDAEK